MTLKVRLAAMMVVILLAVVALQYLLMERERREMLSSLSHLGSEVDRSTLRYTSLLRGIGGAQDPERIAQLLRQAAGDSAGPRTGTAHLQVMVLSDSGGKPAICWNEKIDASVELRPPGARPVDSVTVEARGDSVFRIFRHLSAAGRAMTDSLPAGGEGTRRDIVVNLPVPALAADSLLTLQVRYPYGDLAEELARSRRRGLLWLGLVLAVGVIGALLVAVEFTRPIRSLERSFGQLVEGKLDQKIPVRRRDEMGRLTASFNEMAARLREGKRMEQKLAEAEHFAALGRMAAGVAHEVRNPLNAMLLSVQHLRDLGGGRPEMDRYASLVVSEIERLERLVGAFLDLSRSAEMSATEIDLAASLAASVDLLRPSAAERGITLDLRSPGEVRMRADADRLRMVWDNLLRNAIQASPAGSSVRVAVEHRPEAGVDRVRVTVEDDGKGIAPELLPRIWDPFVSGRTGGTGLGLSIVRSVVERHGGRVEGANRPEGGARFTIELPFSPETSAGNEAGAGTETGAGAETGSETAARSGTEEGA